MSDVDGRRDAMRVPRRASLSQYGFEARKAFAKARGLVNLIEDSAATSPIVTHRLRQGICVLKPVAVLSGPNSTALVNEGASRSGDQGVTYPGAGR